MSDSHLPRRPGKSDSPSQSSSPRTPDDSVDSTTHGGLGNTKPDSTNTDSTSAADAKPDNTSPADFELPVIRIPDPAALRRAREEQAVGEEGREATQAPGPTDARKPVVDRKAMAGSNGHESEREAQEDQESQESPEVDQVAEDPTPTPSLGTPVTPSNAAIPHATTPHDPAAATAASDPTAATDTSDTAQPPRTGWRRFVPTYAQFVTFLVVAGSCGLVFSQLHPKLILDNSLPTGGDMGAHVWGPWYLKTYLFENLRLTGWTPDWYAGFPAFSFYFPLPAILIALLSYLLPYGIAFKLISVSGVVLMPAAAWGMGKFARLRYPAPAALAAGALLFVFNDGFTILGGNIMSTLAGEYSFSIGLCFALLFLGLVAGGLETGGRRVLAGLTLGACIVTHILPTLFALTGGVILLLTFTKNLPSRMIRWGIPVVFLGCMMTAWWALPFIFHSNYMNDMGWEKMGTGVVSGTKLFGESIKDYADALFVNDLKMRAVFVLAVLGAVTSVIFRRRFGIALILLTAVLAFAFIFMPQGRLWNARIIPFYYLTLYLLAMMFLAELGWGIANAFRRKRSLVDVGDGLQIAAPMMAFVVALSMIIPHQAAPTWWPSAFNSIPWHSPDSGSERSDISGWAKWNYEGYDGKRASGEYYKPAHEEYLRVINMMDEIGKTNGCGRVLWEFESDLNRFGTTMALQLLPKYTKGCMGSMEGLFFESSPTVPYHFLAAATLSKAPSNPMRNLPYEALNVSRGVDYLQLMGIKYYLALSPEAIAQAENEPRLQRRDSTSAADDETGTTRVWVAYEVADTELVAPLQLKPNVITAPGSVVERRNPEDVGNKLSPREAWLENQLRWLQQDHFEDTALLAAGGPKDWPRIANADEALVKQPLEQTTRVSNIRTTDDRLSFDVDQTGVPVVVKMSYFPNWTVSGAKGPWRVSPNQMVVIPTKSHVTLHYGRSLLDWSSALASVASVGALWWIRKPVRFHQPLSLPSRLRRRK